VPAIDPPELLGSEFVAEDALRELRYRKRL
jgi:hypothetical protein